MPSLLCTISSGPAVNRFASFHLRQHLLPDRADVAYMFTAQRQLLVHRACTPARRREYTGWEAAFRWPSAIARAGDQIFACILLLKSQELVAECNLFAR